MANILDLISSGRHDDACWFEPGKTEATDKLPGSPAKVDVLAARAKAGVELWHEDDVVCFEDLGETLGNLFNNRTKLNDDSLMPIGKHKGKQLGKIPNSYWAWFARQPWATQYPDLLAYANLNE